MDDDTTRAIDLAAAWPDDDDLTLAGAAEESETLTEVYNETPSEHSEPTSDAGEGTLPDNDDGEHSLDTNGQGLPEGDVVHEEATADVSQSEGSPVSWSATAREQWSHIPKAAQEYIQQREQQMAQGMQKNAEQARRAAGMDRSLAPYQQYLQMNGGPGKSLQALLQTGSGLQMGSPQQKAQIINNLIKQFSVDVPALDAMLTGAEVPPEMQQQNAIQQQINQAIAPFQQREQQMRQQQQQFEQGQRAEAGGEVTTFAQDPKNEFYNDVRGDMADILDMAANRGVNLSLPDAYSKACALNPEISRIMQSREAARNLAPKRRAAASISGGMGGPGGGVAGGTSMAQDIASAWDNAGQI